MSFNNLNSDPLKANSMSSSSSSSTNSQFTPPIMMISNPYRPMDYRSQYQINSNYAVHRQPKTKALTTKNPTDKRLIKQKAMCKCCNGCVGDGYIGGLEGSLDGSLDGYSDNYINYPGIYPSIYPGVYPGVYPGYY